MSTPPADGSGLNGSKSLDSGTSHGAEHALDVVITGRNIDVSAHYQRQVHYGRHQPTSVAAATAALALTLVGEPGGSEHATTIPRGG